MIGFSRLPVANCVSGKNMVYRINRQNLAILRQIDLRITLHVIKHFFVIGDKVNRLKNLIPVTFTDFVNKTSYNVFLNYAETSQNKSHIFL